MRHLFHTLCAGALLLAACNSGSDGLRAGTLPLTSNNAADVVRLVLTSGEELDEMSFGLVAMFEGLDLSEEGTFGCPEGGTYTLDLVGNPPTGGTITFSQCGFDFGDAVTIVDGTIEFEQLDDDTIAFTLDLTAEDGSDEFDLVGDMTIRLVFGTPPNMIVTVFGKAIRTIEDGESFALEDYRIEETVDVSDDSWIATMRALLRASWVGLSVYTETIDPIGADEDDHPTFGSMIVRGAFDSRIRITLNGENIRIELDADGDGVYEEDETTTWEQLFD